MWKRQIVRSNLFVCLAGTGVLLALALGLYARFKGLGTWSLAEDEFHTAQSIRHILLRGIPEFECGGAYTRGLLLQYSGALLLWLTQFQAEFGLRLIIVTSNLLALPALFQLGRRLQGNRVAWAGVILFSLSVWEIEMARYVRMYAPFQAVFVWYMLCLYRTIIDRDTTTEKWLYILSATSVLIWEGGVLLMLLNFLPLLIEERRPSISRVAIAVITLALAMIYMLAPWTTPRPSQGVEMIRPILSEPTLGPVLLPKVFATAFLHTPIWLVLFLTLASAILWIARSVVVDKQLGAGARFLLILWLLFSLINQYALIVYAGVIFWLLGWIRSPDFQSRSFWTTVASIVAMLVFWLAYGFMTDALHILYPLEQIDPLRKVLVVLLKYPDLYWKVFVPWLGGQPSTTLALIALVVLGLALQVKAKQETYRGERLLLAVAIGLAVIVAMLYEPYTVSRYTFFLYPLLILLAAASINRLAQTLPQQAHAALLFAGLLLTYMLVADDYNLRHLLHIDTEEINFRTVYDRERRFHLWNREDYKTTAEFVNVRMQPDDAVVSTRRPAGFYLRRLDYLYMSPRASEFRDSVACGGKREEWTNAPLIYRHDQMLEMLTRSTVTVWLIVRSDRFPWRDSVEVAVADRFRDKRVYRGFGGGIDVYKLEPG